jgi:hypothetical protein
MSARLETHCCRNAKEWEGRTRVLIESMEEKGSLYTRGSGCLAGMLCS